MADPVVLLVTGSRALIDTPAAHAWARGMVHRALDGLAPHRDLVVAGDAAGPDGIASAHAVYRRVRVAQWTRWGDVLGDGARPWERGPRPADSAAWRERLLARDRAMVAWVAAQLGDRRCLAVLAPWSRTRGAAYTAALAERAGIATTVLVCPAELGPAAPYGGSDG